MYWVIGIAVIIVIWLLVIVIRAFAFRPKTPETPAGYSLDYEIDLDRAIGNLQKMIELETIKGNDKAFDDFRDALPDLYPLVHKHCEKELVGGGGLLYRYAGKSGLNPTVFMAHYDVVPADASLWAKPPFSAIHENGEIWGRGALDTKSTLCAALETAETLLEHGFVPESDIYFAFGSNEETYGRDAPDIADLLKSRSVRPGLVLDEGGATVENVFPGVKEKVALIGTGEKGVCDVTLKISGAGGHASMPPKKTPVGQLAKAVVRVERSPFKGTLAEPTKQLFDSLGRHSSFAYRLIFANLWCFKGLLFSLCKQKGGELNAMVRTTVAFTQMEGSPAINVLPPSAEIRANMRLMHIDTPEKAVAHIKRAIKDPDIEVTGEGDVSEKYADTGSDGYEKALGAIRKTWPDAIVSPYLMMARTDSRHFTDICDVVLRFSAMSLSKDDRDRIHGNDERISDSQLLETLSFYQRLMTSC